MRLPAGYIWKVKENKEHKSIFQDHCSMKDEIIRVNAVSDGDLYVSKSGDSSDRWKNGGEQ